MPDAIVVGGGVMGLATARELRRRGLAVTLLERGQTGRAASWASAGIVGAPTGPRTEPGHALQTLSRQLWPSYAAELEADSGLDPEYRGDQGCLLPAFSDDDARDLARAIQRGLIEEGKLLQGAELRNAEPALGPAVVAAAWKPGGNIENRRLCRALELANRQNGVAIRTGVEVRAIRVERGRATGVDLVDESISADVVVVAAGAWTGSLPGCQPAVPVVPQRGQILALDRGDVRLRQVILTPDDPYLVPRADGRIVIGATREMAGWDASFTAGGIAWLLSMAIHIVPALRDRVIHEIWTGFRPLSPDGIPIIGPGAADGLFFATGHGPSGIGPMPGTIALLAAQIFGEKPPLDPEPFSPLRFVDMVV
jgi:glycine oxidase